MNSVKAAILGLFIMASGASSALADHNHFPPPPHFPPHHSHSVVVVGEGKGGTTHGEKDEACARAEERASFDARLACDHYNGWVSDEDYSSCKCVKKKGSKDDYTCEVRVRARCEY
jgi:hypothetical protein